MEHALVPIPKLVVWRRSLAVSYQVEAIRGDQETAPKAGFLTGWQLDGVDSLQI